MNVGVVGLQEPRISVTLYTSKTYLLSAAQTPTQRSDRSYVRNALLMGATVSAQPVVFADANLKAAIEDTLGISDPTPADMLGLTILRANDLKFYY
ncbi:MAG: hypothetical protein ACETVZ_05160 [Phycisphaerae bacterium]